MLPQIGLLCVVEDEFVWGLGRINGSAWNFSEVRVPKYWHFLRLEF